MKPFQKSDLIPAIEMALGRHEQLVALEQENADLAERLEARKLTDRANQLNQELYGPEYIGGKPIAARPYMGPALRAEMPTLPTLWANSIQT